MIGYRPSKRVCRWCGDDVLTDSDERVSVEHSARRAGLCAMCHWYSYQQSHQQTAADYGLAINVRVDTGDLVARAQKMKGSADRVADRIAVDVITDWAQKMQASADRAADGIAADVVENTGGHGK